MLIPGVNGAFPQLLDFDSLSAPFIETQIRFHYQASNVAGEHASESSLCEVAMALLDRLVAEYDYSNENSSFMFFAYDLGGTVVKQVSGHHVMPITEDLLTLFKALFTASMNEKYAIILAKTSLVVSKQLIRLRFEFGSDDQCLIRS